MKSETQKSNSGGIDDTVLLVGHRAARACVSSVSCLSERMEVVLFPWLPAGLVGSTAVLSCREL